MKKRLICLCALALVLVCVFALPATAEAATEGDYTYSVTDGEATITECKDSVSGKITIPSTLGGYPVTAIGERAFMHCSDLTSVIIPDGVTTIGNRAFMHCRALTAVVIPDGVTTFGTHAFYNCRELPSVTIPDSVNAIGESAFGSCIKLTAVTIPDGVTTLGKGMFDGCESLTAVTLPDSVVTIGERAFAYCKSLTAVTLPDNLMTIGDFAFTFCTGLTAVTIPDNVTTIDSYAFSYCSSLTSVTIGDSVASMGQYVFSNCNNLTSITIPDSVVTLGGNVFSYCSGLTSVTFGKGMTTLSETAFSGCNNLISIWVDGDNPNFSSDDRGVLYNKEKTKLVQVPYGFSGTYAIANTVTEIGDSAFSGCEKLEGVEIPASVTTIGSYAFNSCDKLATITIADGVITIGDSAFAKCVGLRSVTFGKSLITIGQFAFYECEELETIVLSDSVTTLEDYAFAKCVNLRSVTLGKSLTTIDQFAFFECAELETIILSDSVTTIGARAFENCGSLTSVTLPAGVTTIGKNAFFCCYSLTGIWVDPDNLYYSSDDCGVLYNKEKTKLVQVPTGFAGTYAIANTVTEIGDYAAYNCQKLEGVEIPAGVTTIGSYAFVGCKNLTGVLLPTSIMTIGDNAFQNCTGLRELFIPKGAMKIGSFAFYNCTGLTKLTISDGEKTFGDHAFTCCDDLSELTLGDGLSGNFMDVLHVCEIKKLIIADGSKKVTSKMVVCEKTLEEVVIPDSVTAIEDYAFCACRKLTYIDIPEGVTTIGKEAFASCENLIAVKIPDKVKTIREYTFDDCKSLVLVWLPKSLVAVEDNAFGKCDSLTEVYFDGFDRELEKVTVGKGNEDFLYATLYCRSSLSIVTQPKNVVVSSGKTAKVTVKASGVGLKYTWYYAKKGSSKFTKVSGSSATYSVKMSSSVDGRKVYCVVTDQYGSQIKTNTVTLYKGTPAKITTQPKSVTVVGGKTGELTIKASGSSLTYTWYAKNKGATSFAKVGKSSKTYSFKMASKLDGCQVYCVIKDKFGITVKSSVVTIKQAPKPKITTQPKSIAEVNGKTVKFSVKASGEGLKYQWYYAKKGSNSFKKLSGKTSAIYSVKVSSSVNGRKYYCLVTDKYGQTVKSSAVTLTLKTVAKITTQPKSVTVVGGSTAKLTVKAVGDGAKYAWYYLPKGETKYTKASSTGTSFSVKMADKYNGAQVYCAVSDKYGNTVKSTVVTIKQAPVPKITTQPKSVLQVSGKTVKFSVKASGEGLKYQWYYAKKGSNSFKKLSGAKSATYSVKVSSSVNGRKYYCLVTDKYGQTVKSSAVTLTMKTVAKITTQPKSVTVKNGKTAKVTIKAVGDGVTYTWYYLKPGATKYAKATATGASYSVKMAAAWKNAKVYCVIADKYGNTVKSKVVTLKMK